MREGRTTLLTVGNGSFVVFLYHINRRSQAFSALKALGPFLNRMELVENGNSPRIKLPSADSFDEDLSDVDDEVFIKSSKNGYRRVPTDRHLKKPLMAPRRKHQKGMNNGHSNGNASEDIKTASPKGCPAVITFLYAVIGIGAFAGIAGIVSFLSRSHLLTLIKKISTWNETNQGALQFAHCDTFEVENLWNLSLPYALFDHPNAIITFDINNDNVDDIIVGSATGIDKPSSSFLCELVLNTSSELCDGRLSAVDGRNGSLLWTTYLDEKISGISCRADLNHDGVLDCIVVGTKQFIWAVSGANGKVIWQAAARSAQSGCSCSPLPVPTVISDVNGDKIVDILIGLDTTEESCMGYIELISGQSGKVLQLIPVPESKHLAISPILWGSGDGLDLLLLITRSGSGKDGESGSLVPVTAFLRGKNEDVRVLWNNTSQIFGLMLTDINNDGMEDVILGFANNSVSVFCGSSWNILWSAEIQGRFLGFQAAANLNHDKFNDIVIRVSLNHNGTTLSSVQVLDGSNGNILMNFPPRKEFWTIHGATVAIEGIGQDIVIDWSRDSSNEKALNRLSGFSSHGELPGLSVYDSTSSFPVVHEQITSLELLLQVVNEREDVRVRYSHFVRRGEATEDPRPALEETEPKLIGYPSQHGVRKHGRWSMAKPLPYDDYELKPQIDNQPPPNDYYEDEDVDYRAPDSFYYKHQQPPRKTYPSGQKRGWRFEPASRRGKREVSEKEGTVMINFSPLLLNSDAETPGSTDVLFATQLSYPETENLVNRISKCVSQRMESRAEEPEAMENILECSGSSTEGNVSPDLVGEIKRWLEPLSMRFGNLVISRNRLRCRCHHELRYSDKPCSRIEPLYTTRPAKFLP